MKHQILRLKVFVEVEYSTPLLVLDKELLLEQVYLFAPSET